MARFFILLIVVLLFVLARKSKPAGNKEGNDLLDFTATQFSSNSTTLNVATYNIQTGKDNNGKRHLMGSAKVIQQADLVGIQEVYASSFLNLMGFGMSQTHVLAKYGGFGWIFAATRRRWLKEHRGNAILSKLPISNWTIEMLTDESNKSFRNMTIAKVQWLNKEFHFINTHLHTRGGRETQLLEVLQEFAKYPRAILVGDFNSRANTPALAQALKDIEITDAIEHVNLDTNNVDRIDWILTKGFDVLEGTMIEKGVSDHPYYQVSLSYKN